MGENDSAQLTLGFYETHAEDFAADTQKLDFSAIQDRFLEQLPTAAFILDFGCGAGRDTKYFLEKGYTVKAVDGARALCEIASAYAGIPVEQIRFETFEAQEQYDGIWACASILHLVDAELKHVLSRLGQALKPNGCLYTSFKYGTFQGMRDGRYFADFTEDTFCGFLQDVPELQIQEIWISGDARAARSGGKWLNILMRKSNILCR